MQNTRLDFLQLQKLRTETTTIFWSQYIHGNFSETYIMQRFKETFEAAG